jgi:hypothetical protein
MTREEKIREMIDGYEKEYAIKDCVTVNSFSKEELITARVEFEQGEINELKNLIFKYIASVVNRKVEKEGDYEILIGIARRGDFDFSEEACARRQALKDGQEEMISKIKLGIEEIDKEYGCVPEAEEVH